MYFAFVDHYSKKLHLLVYAGCAIYFTVRFIDWPVWMCFVSIYGFLVPAVWCPLMIRKWEQKQTALALRWEVSASDMSRGKAKENPHYDPGKGQPKAKRFNVITERLEDTYNDAERKQYVIPALMFLTVCCLLIPAIISPFIQWYTWSKMTWTCDDPKQTAPMYFVNCFDAATNTVGTDRWLYILIQGIIMGLIADVLLAAILGAGADYFTTKENYRTVGEYEERKIAKRWGFE